MPTYLGQPVSDDYLQGLIAAYREGQKAEDAPVEDGDQVVIDRLADCGVTKDLGADVVGRYDGRLAIAG